MYRIHGESTAEKLVFVSKKTCLLNSRSIECNDKIMCISVFENQVKRENALILWAFIFHGIGSTGRRIPTENYRIEVEIEVEMFITPK